MAKLVENSPWRTMYKEYQDHERMITTIKAACYQSNVSDNSPLYKWLRFDVVQSLESCTPVMQHYMDIRDLQKFWEFEWKTVLPIFEKVIDAYKKIPKNMIGTLEWFLIKTCTDKIFYRYVKIKERNE